MPESKQAAKAAPSKSEEDLFQKALDQGFFGDSPKTIPNKAFTLETGPDSPSPASQLVDARRAQLAQAELSLHNDDSKKG